MKKHFRLTSLPRFFEVTLDGCLACYMEMKNNFSLLLANHTFITSTMEGKNIKLNTSHSLECLWETTDTVSH